MALFRYRALLDGRKVKGLIDAENLEEAKSFLFKKGLVLFFIASRSEKRMALNKRELYNFTSELAKLLKAHLPIYEALLTLEEKYRGNKVHPLFLDISAEVKGGSSLSKALKRHPQSFDFLYVSLVANAEKAGNLALALEELAYSFEKELKARREVLKALLYPSIVLSFSLIILSALIFFVIPSLFEIFEGRSLNQMTLFVLNLSHFANDNRLLILLFIFSLAFLLWLMALSSSLKAFLKSFFIKLFFLERFFVKFSLARFCRSFSALLKGGLPHMEALSLAALALSYPPLKKSFEEICRKVEEGEKFSRLLDDVKLAPPFMRRLIAIAEEGGSEIEILQHVSDIFEEELEKELAQITALIQPVMLIILGFIVGALVLSVLLPLTDVSSI